MTIATRARISWLLALVAGLFAAHASDIQEYRAGCFIDQYMVNHEALLYAPALEERVHLIVSKLQTGNSLPDPFQIRILNSPVVNAYAAPGGFLYVTSGLLQFSTNDDELAGVLAHEMAHVSQHHYFQEFQELQKKSEHFETFESIAGFLVGLGAGLAVGPPRGSLNLRNVLAREGKVMAIAISGSVPLGLAGGAVLALSITGYHRERELEADALAIKYTANAGYNPRAFIAVLKRLALLEDRARNAHEPQHVSKLINAQPGLKKRIERLEQVLS